MTKVVGVRAPPPAPRGRIFLTGDKDATGQNAIGLGRRKVMSMQVTETSAAGLKREYHVVVPACDLEAPCQ